MSLFELAADVVDWIGDLIGADTPDPGAAGLPAAPAVAPVPDLGLASGTQAVLDMTNGMTADASTLYHDAMDPGSVPAGEVAAASTRIDNAVANSGLVQGDTYRQEIANKIAVQDLAAQTADELSRMKQDLSVVTHGEA